MQKRKVHFHPLYDPAIILNPYVENCETKGPVEKFIE